MLEAVRFGLFAEKVAPMLTEAKETLATPLPTDPADKIQVAKAKTQAQEAIAELRAALLLDVEDD